MEKPVLYTLKHQPTAPRKQPQPDVVTAVKAGLHPGSKTVRGLKGLNRRKQNG